MAFFLQIFRPVYCPAHSFTVGRFIGLGEWVGSLNPNVQAEACGEWVGSWARGPCQMGDSRARRRGWFSMTLRGAQTHQCLVAVDPSAKSVTFCGSDGKSIVPPPPRSVKNEPCSRLLVIFDGRLQILKEDRGSRLPFTGSQYFCLAHDSTFRPLAEKCRCFIHRYPDPGLHALLSAPLRKV